jgi:hypothetical protein
MDRVMCSSPYPVVGTVTAIGGKDVKKEIKNRNSHFETADNPRPLFRAAATAGTKVSHIDIFTSHFDCRSILSRPKESMITDKRVTNIRGTLHARTG